MATVRITKLDEERYTNGDCHILAHEIHKITGWPFHCFIVDGYADLHAFVVTPSKRVLDVRGPCALKTFYEQWGHDQHRACDPEAVKREWGGAQFGPHSSRRAERLAQHLVTRERERAHQAA